AGVGVLIAPLAVGTGQGDGLAVVGPAQGRHGLSVDGENGDAGALLLRLQLGGVAGSQPGPQAHDGQHRQQDQQFCSTFHLRFLLTQITMPQAKYPRGSTPVISRLSWEAVALSMVRYS